VRQGAPGALQHLSCASARAVSVDGVGGELMLGWWLLLLAAIW
jgi:hypothetical protein